MGTILSIPFPQILNTTTVTSAISASGQQVEAFPMAEGARESPIQMIIGPVTTGGRYFMTVRTPICLTRSASTR